MARLTIGQKAQKTLRLLFGLNHPRIAERMHPYGFDEAERQRGWGLLQGLTAGKLRSAPARADPKLYEAVDAWENHWFPIANASLRFRAPAVHRWLFDNLRQTEGLEVVISVGTFHQRLEQLPTSGVEGAHQALAILNERGLTPAVRAEAGELLAQIRAVAESEPAGEVISAEEKAQREEALWRWYLEWSEITRTVIKDYRLLRLLGFRTRAGRTVEDDEGPEEEAELDSAEEADEDAPSEPPMNGASTGQDERMST